MEVKKVGVIGAGTMGHGIVQVFATCGYQVVVRDIAPEFVQPGVDRLVTGIEHRCALTSEAPVKGDFDIRPADSF